MSWQLSSSLVLVAVVVCGFLWYERRRPPAKVLALVAALAALAVVGRLAFAAIPNVKPTTDIVLFAGYALGPAPGFAVGAVTALVSNLFLSQGPWTPWQMAGWGGVGVAGALLARAARGKEPGRWPLAVACGLAGLAFGAWMDVYQWTLAARQDAASYVAVAGSSLPYNAAHAIGNVAFSLLIGPPFVRALRRYRRRFEVRWEATAARRLPAAGAATVALLALLVSLSLAAAAAPPSDARVSAGGLAARYLLRAQNRDGGFGAARGQASSQLFTGWAALGLASAGRNPRDVHRRGGRAITTYLRRRAGSLRDIGEIERTILVLKAGGLSPRSFAGRDLVGEVLRRRRADGSFAGYVSYTAFGLLALRAAGKAAPGSSVAWLEASQNADGGFGVARGAASDADMTGAVLQALAAAGRSGREPARRATGYLRASQNADGGFGPVAGRGSNAQSTAYAVQGLIAGRASGDSVGRALGYLRSLQRADGSVRYSRASAQTPVWVTAQALAALERKTLPLATVPRARRARRRSAAAAEAGTGGHGDAGVRRPARRPAPVAPRRATGSAPSRVLPEAARARGAGTSPEEDPDAGGPSAAQVAVAVAAVVLALGLLRRWLRRRSRPAAA